jgi:large subunit ribosomal protein L10
VAARTATKTVTSKVNEEKRAAVTSIAGIIREAKDLIFTDFRGLSVAQITELRNRLRSQNALYKVIKNSYARRALSELGLPETPEFLIGPTALVLIQADAGPSAKMILDFGRAASVKVKGGIIGGKVYTSEEVQALSKLPSRDQLISMLMSTMGGPIQNTAFILKAVIQKLISTVKAVAEAGSKEKT